MRCRTRAVRRERPPCDGLIGGDLKLEEGYDARLTALSINATLKLAVGDLGRIGASDLIIQLSGT